MYVLNRVMYVYTYFCDIFVARIWHINLQYYGSGKPLLHGQHQSKSNQLAIWIRARLHSYDQFCCNGNI